MYPMVFYFLVIQRLLELGWAWRNTKLLLSQGAYEIDRENYKWLVIFHSAWIFILGMFVFKNTENSFQIWALVLFGFIEAMRIWVLSTLGSRWTTRVIRLPQETPVVCGPYRWIRHPNYLVVMGELLIVPLIYGFWWMAFVGSLIHIVILRRRIKVENLAWS